MTRHTRAHGALAGDRPESPTCKCFIALTHFQRLKRETEIQTEFTVPSSHQLQASGEARAFLTRESTSRGKQEGEGRAGPPGAAQRPSPLVPHPLPPGEKCSQNNPHSLEATLCPPSFRGGRSLADMASGAGLGPHLQNRDNAQLQPLCTHWARLSPQPVLGVPPRAGT